MSLAYKDYEKITTLTAAVGLTLPSGPSVNYVLIEVEGQDVRYKGDGTDPTAALGGLMKANTQYEYEGNLGALKFIEVTAGAILNVTYFFKTGS